MWTFAGVKAHNNFAFRMVRGGRPVGACVPWLAGIAASGHRHAALA